MQGHTLVEIVVVLVIISMTTAVAIITLGHNTTKQAENFAKELAQTIALAEEQALLQPATLGFIFTAERFGFYEYHHEKNTPSWQPLNSTALGEQRLPATLQLTASTAASPALIITTNGTLTPFKLFIGRKNAAPLYELIGSSDGTVRYQRYRG
jgi:general secretion pathway protein H